MRVFLTGGTGYIGSSVAEAFVRDRHEVTALVRSPDRASALVRMGAVIVTGDLRAPSSYRRHLGRQDVLVHTALEYGERATERTAIDTQTVRTLLVAARAGAQLIYTSNAYLLGGLGELDEDSQIPPLPPDRQWRIDVEREVLREAPHAAVVRPGMCFGGCGGTFPHLFIAAARTGRVPVVEAGRNPWSICHVRDLAHLYLVVATQAGYGVYHGTDGVFLTYQEVAEQVSRAAGTFGRTEHVPLATAVEREGRHAEMLTRDVAIIPRRSRAIGWAPRIASFTVGVDAAYAEWRDACAPPS